MSAEFKKKFDTTWVGFALGLVAPVISLYFFYLIKYSHLTFSEFYYMILVANGIVRFLSKKRDGNRMASPWI